MEGWNWNGGRGSSWSYRQVTVGSNASSSSSGTIVSRLSTDYASSGSRFSTFSMEEPMPFGSLDDWEEAEEEMGEARVIKIMVFNLKKIEIMVWKFFSGPSANCIIKRGDQSVVERWLTELGVGWVLILHDAVEEQELDRDARTWIRALHQIAETIRTTASNFPDRRSTDMPSICVEQGEHVSGRCSMDRYHLALFIQETILKMLAFVDVLVAWDPNTTTQEFLTSTMGRVIIPLPCNKLIILLGVHDALSSYKILELFHRATSKEVKSIENAMDNLLSAYTSKLGDAIWSTMEKATTTLLEDVKDSSTSLNLQGSAGIHMVTRSVMTYIRYLWANYSSVDAAIRVKRVPHIESVRPLDSVIMEMVSFLQEKLANISESFPDQGLRFLFLLNNSNCIQQIHDLLLYSLQQPRSKIEIDFTHKIEDLVERYLQASWAPLLSWLFNPAPLCLGKNYSPLSKFESEFQKIYSAQMEWKVPDPVLRRRLRNIIIDKIIPGYTEYIEDNKVTNPKFSPHELKEMLQDLFEG